MKSAVLIVCVAFAPLLADDEQLAAHAREAKAAEARHDYKKAIGEYRILTRLVPDNPQIRTNLAIALYLDGDSAGALAECQRASKLAPDLFAPHLFAGLAWFRLGTPDQAETELARAIQINRSDAVAHLWLGYVHMAQSRYERAVEELKQALAAQPDDMDARYTLGKAYLEMGRLAVEKLLEVAPDGGRAWQLAAEQCQMRGDRSKAFELYRGAYQRRPDVPEIQALSGGVPSIGRATPIAGEDDLFRAARAYESLAKETFGRIAPDSYRAHEVVADSLAAGRRNTEAVAEYRIVLGLKPDLPAIHQAIGTLLFEDGHAADATREFEAELTLQPNSAMAHVNLARALLVVGKEAGAEKHLAAAIHLDRPPAAALKLLAKASLRRQNDREAIPLLEQYTKSVPNDSSAHYLLARAYRAVDNGRESDREMRRYQELSMDVKNRSAARLAIEATRIE